MHDVNVQARDVSMTRTAAIHCLPALLGEDDSDVFKVCREAELRTSENSCSPMCILSIVLDDKEGNAVFLQPSEVNIILEGRVVTSSIHSWPDAFMYLFGLIYALHLNYPKSMLNTFLFIQQVLLHIDGDKLKPKILALTKKL
ncbi:hypothetical protein L3Q82_010777 [Scortum barcoo]|uniref:Uncharacterized protein n=1 Tax=Scortum barcoo TaxID=214431 RepID=A0ACB8W801_9TELE|nr:hypothetical protein L3Q82_010777 [Scortum barcoo]